MFESPAAADRRARCSALEARLLEARLLQTPLPQAPLPGGHTAATRSCTAWTPRRRAAVLAREHGFAYDASTPPGDPAPAAAPVRTAPPPPGLRDAIIEARNALEHVRDLAATQDVGGGAVGGLLDLLQAIDAGKAAATTLTGRIQRHRLAPRATGLTLESFLASQGPLPGRERRALLRTATTLEGMPLLREAVATGVVPAAALTSITAEARGLDVHARGTLDAAFVDHGRLGRLDPEELVQAVRDRAAELAPAARDRDQLRPIEDRFLSLQPRLDGSLTGYFELDAESGATLLEAIESVAPPPSAGPKDVTAHAHDTSPAQPVVPPSWRRRARGRQRADGLVRLAEDHLAGITPGAAPGTAQGTAPGAPTPGMPEADDAAAGCSCRHRRARPRFLVLTDVATLTGNDELATTSQLLWAAVGSAPRLTPDMVRRLASDADLQLVLHDDGALLGITSPEATIPAPVRAAVLARDRGCRFPGCQAPPRYLDLHHVVPREEDGPTTCDNLVGLCRRHHTAVTKRHWSLSMTADGVVTVRRGRRTATSDPPHRRQLRPRQDVAGVATGSPAGRSAATTRPPPTQTVSSGE